VCPFADFFVVHCQIIRCALHPSIQMNNTFCNRSRYLAASIPQMMRRRPFLLRELCAERSARLS